MPDMWDSVAPGWQVSAQFVDGHLALAIEALLDAAGIGEGDAVLDLAAGPGGAGLAMETDAQEEIAQRAISAGAKASRREGDEIVFSGSVLIGSGHTPRH